MTREQIVAELRNAALLEALSKPGRAAPPTRTDGEQGCRNCGAMAEQIATHRAEKQLLVNGPVPAQEAVAFTHLVRQASLAKAKGTKP